MPAAALCGSTSAVVYRSAQMRITGRLVSNRSALIVLSTLAACGHCMTLSWPRLGSRLLVASVLQAARAHFYEFFIAICWSYKATDVSLLYNVSHRRYGWHSLACRGLSKSLSKCLSPVQDRCARVNRPGVHLRGLSGRRRALRIGETGVHRLARRRGPDAGASLARAAT